MSKSRYQRRAALTPYIQALPKPLLGGLRWLRDRLTPQGRMQRWLERQHSLSLLQPSPMTWRDRHPELFAIARERLGGAANGRVLSFGCSTGEEAFTLADYLPGALIDAIDINPRSIAIAERARASDGAASVQFICDGSPPPEPSVYDAIFCLSVLRHGRLDAERPASCAQIMPFARFAETIAAFEHSLKPGGLLFLWGCNFRLADTPSANAFDVIEVPGKRVQAGAFYGPENLLLPIATNADFVFEKLAGTVGSSLARVELA